MIQPNAQVCRRLAGASLECRPSFLPFLASLQSVGRSGRVPPRCPPVPIVPLRVPSSPTGPAVVPRDFNIHHYHRQLRHASASASAGTGERAERSGAKRAYDGFVCGKRAARLYVCICARRRRYVTSSHGNQCSWPPTRSHGAKPTRPASCFGHLCASARTSYLSLTLSLFLDLSPVAPPRDPLSRRATSVSLRFLFFLFFFFPPSFFLPARPPLYPSRVAP